jgi:hypothetical protein
VTVRPAGVVPCVGLTISQPPPDAVFAVALKFGVPELAPTVKLQFELEHCAACPDAAENEIIEGAPFRVGTTFTVKLTVTCTCVQELGATQVIVNVP